MFEIEKEKKCELFSIHPAHPDFKGFAIFYLIKKT